MKINIQIEDASPEEAALIFSGVVVSEAVGRAARKAVEKIVVRKPVPDPTCIEETGCAGCNETGLTDACEKCSPPVVKKEPASKKVAPEKKAIPEKKKIDNRSLGNNPNRWSHEEIASIENCPDQKAAAKRYANKFPDSKRRPWAVEQRWYIITKGKRGITPGAKGPVKPDSRATNFDAAIWSDEEKQIAQDANTRKGAIASYREKYPESIRSDDAIGRQFYGMCPDKRSPNVAWTDEEKQPILSAGCVEDAIADYQNLFPESKRTIAAISREWYELRPEKRGEIPTGRKNGGTNKAPLRGTAREKYQIPFSTTQDQKGYNHAVYICTKYDKPYEEAVKLEEADLKANKEKKADKIFKTPKTPPVRKERLPFHQNQKPDPAVDDWPDDDHDIVIEGIDGLEDKMPETRPPTRGDRLNSAPVPAIPAEFKIGVHVKQIKPYLDRKVSGIGAVTALVKGLVEVNFGGQQYYKIAPDCLEVI